MSRTVIIGYGNTLRGDDAAGWLAAEALSQRFRDESVTVLKAHQLTPELGETISAFDVAIFVDATTVGAPGDVRCRPVEPAPSESGLTHSASPGGLLAMARELYGHAPKAFLISLTGESFELGEELSSPVAAALPKLLDLVKAKVEELRPPGDR